MAGAGDFRVALDKSLQKLNREGLQMKDKQYDALRSALVERKDTVCILHTGYGNSLIFQNNHISKLNLNP